MARRCSNDAGFAGLSAFCVARRRSKRVARSGFSWTADDAIWRWARVGGLKEASRT